MAQQEGTKGFFDLLSSVFSGISKPVADIYSLMPDSLLFGSLLLYITTRHLAYGVFAVFLIEVIISHIGFSWFFTQATGAPRTEMTNKDTLIRCRAGYKTPQWNATRIFSHNPYPSYGTFAFTAVATYLGLSMSGFSETLDRMGEATKEGASLSWKSRIYVAYLSIFLIVSIFIMARMSSCGDKLGEIGLAMFLALIIGVVGYSANKAIFGMEGMNFLGLPYLVSKESQGSPIYVCGPSV